MKISNSKKQLAKIIHENGGWREGAEFTAQDGDGTGSIDFFKSKPRLYKGDIFWKGDYDCDNRIERTRVTIKNWHQTILSREEYFHLYPTPDADGWIEWKGGECPVAKGTLVDVRFKNGMEMVGAPAGQTPDHLPRNITAWARSNAPGAVIAYRLHKQSEPQFCESVMRSIPEPEAQPTIEQLAADYRNLKDFADRKQEEAKAAKADAKAKLAELVAAGKALGLVLSVAPAQKYTGTFYNAKLGTPSHYETGQGDEICEGCGRRFGSHCGVLCGGGPQMPSLFAIAYEMSAVKPVINTHVRITL